MIRKVMGTGFTFDPVFLSIDGNIPILPALILPAPGDENR